MRSSPAGDVVGDLLEVEVVGQEAALQPKANPRELAPVLEVGFSVLGIGPDRVACLAYGGRVNSLEL